MTKAARKLSTAFVVAPLLADELNADLQGHP